jgi:predicted 2-oxoglutarate/Fe(II)-dependent dioxygenase YbiX
MREENGRTVLKYDHTHKKRKDFIFNDQPEFETLRNDILRRVHRRIAPEVKKAFHFDLTRMERYIVSCYESESGGFFAPHRDNTTKGTAHRRFACSINLNAEDYEGGNLRFPEFGSHFYRAPTGGAVVFSCSLLHEATPVTKGRRFAFLPFFYDEAGNKIREENQKYLNVA